MRNKSIYGLSLTAFFALFVGVTLVFLLWPELDLVVHRMLYDREGMGFPGQQVRLFEWVAQSVEVICVLVVILPVLILFGNWLGRNVMRVPMNVPMFQAAGEAAGCFGRIRNILNTVNPRAVSGRIYAYLILSLALGPGLVVNEIFKNHWGRARPRQIAEFGGTADFTPPWLPTDQCARNCSFTSGDASVGFWLVTVAFLLPEPWRMRAILASIGGGLFVGYARMAVGAHFFSDVLYSGLFVYLVARCVHAVLLAPQHRLQWSAGRVR